MSGREEFEKWYANNFDRKPTEVGYETDICWQAWQAARAQGVPEGQIVDCPYACGWQNLQSIITKNAAYFARETIDDDFPEEIRQSGIASGQYALELCRFARRLSTPAAPQADEWVKCADRLPEKGVVVLVFVDYAYHAIKPSTLTAHWTGSTFKIGPNSVNFNCDAPVVTHWMPLPQPPEQGDGV